MKKFSYSAVNQQGVRQKGEILAANQDRALEMLRERGLIVTGIKEERKLDLSNIFASWRGVPMIEIIVFSRQLAVMLEAGIPIVRALRTLQEQARDHLFAETLKEITFEVDGGSSLYRAMSNHPKVFSELYLSLIEAGEKSGNLVTVLSRLADTLQRENDFRSKTKGAMIYPAVIMAAMLMVVILMFVFVIPRLKGLYEELGATLPITTRILLQISSFMVNFWWLVLILLVGMVILLKHFAATEQGEQFCSRLQLKLPVFGMLIKQMQFTSFTRTLSMLISAGIPILQSLDIAKKTMSNFLFQRGIEEAAKNVEHGGSLGEALSHNPNFPSMLAEMVKVGEETGKLDNVLLNLASYYENESMRTVDNLSSLLEPLIMIILGIGVGFLVLSLIMPIYSLTSQF